MQCARVQELIVVVASSQADRVLSGTTDMIVQAHPGHPLPDQMLRAFKRIAAEVADAWGWRPHTAAEAPP